MPRIRLPVLVAALALVVPTPGWAQDIVEGFRRQGLSVPPEVQRVLAQDPSAFEFRRAWIQKAQRVQANRAALERRAGLQLDRGQMVTARASVTGELAVPTIGALYAGQTALYTRAQFEDVLFGEGGAGRYSARTVYRENSRGLFELGGVVPTWPSLPQSAAYYRPHSSTNSTFGRTGEFLRDALTLVDPEIDFSQYDNDGPDGVPNSGDDDGYVDVVAFLYQDAPKSCGGPGIWPHRWVYEGWWSSAFTTGDAAANGGFIRVSDYMIQAGLGCDGQSLMEIGTYAHEMGHALGLPDLYDTNSSNGGSEGIGHWGLMGSGNWNRQDAPAHLSAWSKDQLGWVTIETLTESRTALSLEPVYDQGRVLRYDVPVSDEYFLLEHRRPTGSDKYLHGPGLLVWHIDPTRTGNGDENRKLVDLEEADGRYDLDHSRNRGDAGDPFPGSSARTGFNPGTDPSSNDNLGNASGFALANISLTGSTLTFDVVLSSNPFLTAGDPPSFVASVGTITTDTLRIATHDGSSIGVKVTHSREWLTVSPDTSATPVDLVLVADAGALAPGLYYDTLRVSSSVASNDPLLVPVVFRVATSVLALGDSVLGSLTGPGQVDTFHIELTAGDTVDLTVQPWGPASSAASLPRMEIDRPEGTLLGIHSGNRLWTGLPDCCFYSALRSGWVVAESGVHTVRVSNSGKGSDYVIRARPFAPVVHAQPQWNLDFIGVANGGSVVDTVWIWNRGPTSSQATWSTSQPSAPWVTVAPTGGVLQGLGLALDPPVERGSVDGVTGDGRGGLGMTDDPALAPIGATPWVVTVDFSSLPENRHFAYLSDLTLSDGWGGGLRISLEVWAQDPQLSILAQGLDYGTSGVAVRPDGRVVVATGGDLVTFDPADGSRSTLAAAVAASWGIWGLTLGADGAVYAADRSANVIRRVAPDGSVSTVYSASEGVYDVALAPDGTMYVARWGTGLWRVDPDGTATNVGSTGDACCHYAVAYDRSADVVYLGVRNVVWRYTPASGEWKQWAQLSDWIYDLAVGASGKLYTRGYVGLFTYSASGTQLARSVGPNYGFGLALGEGVLWGTSYGCEDDFCGAFGRLFSVPVDDGPAPSRALLATPGSFDLSAVPGDTARTTLEIAASDGGAVPVSLARKAAWLTLSADSGSTPLSVKLEAVPPSATAASYEDTVWVTASGVANSPLPVLVRFEVRRPPVTAWVPTDTASKSDTVSVPVFVDLSTVDKALGSYQGSLTWNVDVATFVSLDGGDFVGSFDAQIDSAGSGVVSFAGISAADDENRDTTAVALLRLRVVGDGGTSTALDLDLSSVAATDFTNLDSDLTVRDGALYVSEGVWGDPNRDKLVTALDALICLSAVVGKPVSQFDVASCDVAPDVDANGDGKKETFDGTVTALDALAVLSYVVGKPLPPEFRPGKPR